MNIFQAFILGLVQGLTEFLPVSSSGHLVLLSKLTWWQAQPLVFDTTLHLATALTLVVYFWKDLVSLATSFVNDAVKKRQQFSEYTNESKLLFYIIVGSIPAALLGFLFESDFEERFRSVESVALFMLAGSILMYAAQKYGKPSVNTEKVGLAKSLKIGLFQSLALFPGVSRSGSTISGALFSGLNRTEAARFSFLLSIPIVVMAGGYKLISTDWSTAHLSLNVLAVGFVTSFVVGLGVVHFLLNYLKTRNLDVFIAYRLILVAVLLLLLK